MRPDHPLLIAYEKLQKAQTPREVSNLVSDHKLPLEAIPPLFLGEVCVWEALLENMTTPDIVRHLNRMSYVGLCKNNLCEASKIVRTRLLNLDGGVHPIQLMIALSSYSSGKEGDMTWTPVGSIVSALEVALNSSLE